MLGVGELEREGVFAVMSGLSGGAEGLQLALRGAVDLLHLADLGLEGAEEGAVRGGESDFLAELRDEFVEGLVLGVAVGERLAEKRELVLEGLALFLGERLIKRGCTSIWPFSMVSVWISSAYS